MSKKTKTPYLDPLSLIPKASATDLRGRQSIRVAFKLTPSCIRAMNILGAHLRVKPKSLFDHLVRDRKTLEAMAAQADAAPTNETPRTTKTYVISREAALILDEVARDRELSRDLLVESSVQLLMPLIQKEQVRHSARKTLLARMEHHLREGRKMCADMEKELGVNDPMCDKMQHVMGAYERAFAAMAKFIKRGENIEGFKTEG
jgi:hypothetical protein